MNEIGGYIELQGFKNKEYHNNALALNLARNCLVYLIKAKSIKKIYLPYYMCSSLDIIKDYCEIVYYRVNNNFLPIYDEQMEDNEYIYIVNFFGQIGNNKIKSLKNKYKNIIIDNVQAFFQKPVKEIDTIYSCRKFLGVPDGAYLYTNSRINENIEIDYSINRFKHLLGRAEKNAQTYFREYQENEKELDNQPLLLMSKLTHILLGAIQYQRIKRIRTSNYRYLRKKLEKYNGIKTKNIVGAYSYPFYIENADELRKKLINEKIFVPTLWPNVLELEKEDEISYKFAKNILPLPLDQRYNEKDMEFIINIIINGLKKENNNEKN